MRIDVEGDLARTLQAAFDVAPPPAPAFPEAVTRIRRQRRRRRNAGLTGALAALLAVVSFGVVTLRPGAAVVADFAQALDAREVWPEAVVTLPARLYGNLDYTVEAALGDDTFLVQPSEHAPVLLIGSTGQTRPLDGEFPDDAVSSYDITARYITWSISASSGRDVYAQPRDGDAKSVYLGHLPDTDVSVAESDGVFYASGSTRHGNETDYTMYRLAAGQAPVPVPYGNGYALVSGPWAVYGGPQPGAANRLPRPWPEPNLARVLTEPRQAPTYWNVGTGQRVTPAGRASIISCTPAACVGHDSGSLVTWDADGSNEARTAGFTLNLLDRADAFFSSSGRFVQVSTSAPRDATAAVTSNHLWDRTTGKVGTVHGDLAYDVVELDGDKSVLDLTRIR
jgi:hypothetical protein